MTAEPVLNAGGAGPDEPWQPKVPVLVPFGFWMPWPIAAGEAPSPPDAFALSAAITAHLANLGWPGAEPLRWAITAVDPNRGLQLEGVGIWEAGALPEDRG